jgi:hypothetical protein
MVHGAPGLPPPQRGRVEFPVEGGGSSWGARFETAAYLILALGLAIGLLVVFFVILYFR